MNNPKSGIVEIKELFCVLNILRMTKWDIKKLEIKRLEINKGFIKFQSCSLETIDWIILIWGTWKVLFSKISLKNSNKKKEITSEQKVEKINIKNFNYEPSLFSFSFNLEPWRLWKSLVWMK